MKVFMLSLGICALGLLASIRVHAQVSRTVVAPAFQATNMTGPNFIANATSGPPVQVNSTAQVNNLNVDFLNGFHASAFAQLSSSNLFTANQTVQGTVNASSFVGNGSGLSGISFASTAGSAGTFTGSLAGDVSGTQSATFVHALRSIALATNLPTDGQVLTYSASSGTWQPQTQASSPISTAKFLNDGGNTQFNLLNADPNTPAGLYRVSVYLVCSAVGGTYLINKLHWYDFTGAEEFVTLNSSNGCTTVGQYLANVQVISLQAGSGIFDNTYSDGGAFHFFATVERLMQF